MRIFWPGAPNGDWFAGGVSSSQLFGVNSADPLSHSLYGVPHWNPAPSAEKGWGLPGFEKKNALSP